jgi:hypothetical protein
MRPTPIEHQIVEAEAELFYFGRVRSASNWAPSFSRKSFNCIGLQRFRQGSKLGRRFTVTTATRSQVLPDLPAVGDFLPGYEASAWYGVAAPKNTPSHIIGKLNTEMNAGLADAAGRARLAELGGYRHSRLSRRFREARRRRNRQMGQGG